MKDKNMKNENKHLTHFCQVCNSPLIFVPHYEYDGVTEVGSFEPYFECPNGCLYPEYKDCELNAEELAERGKVDTQTDFGIVDINNYIRGSIVI